MSIRSAFKKLEVHQKDEAYAAQGATRWGNRDIYPIIEAERTYTARAFFFYWFTGGISLSSWTLGSSLIGYGLTAGQSIGAVLVGSVVAAVNAFLCAEAGRDHHLNFTMMGRATFGLYGSYLCIGICVLQSLIYSGIQSYFGGQAIVLILSAIFPTFLRMKNTIPEAAGITTQALIGFLLYWVVYIPIIWVPPFKLQKFLYPSFFLVCCSFAGVLGWAMHTNGGPGNLVSPAITISKTEGNFRMVQGICSVAGAYTGGTVRISDWTRFAKTRKASTMAMLFAYPVTITVGAVVGVMVTSATTQMYGEVIWNPLLMLQHVQTVQYTAACRAGTFFAGIGFLSSQIFVNLTANTVSSGMDLCATFPKYLTLRRACVLMSIVGIVIQPWRFLSQATTFVSVISSFGVFVAPMTGILVTDYWLVRKSKWKIPDLYQQGGIYWYTAGLNWRAFVTFCICVAPSMPGFVVSINLHPIAIGWTRVYQLTFFIGYASSAIIYYAINYCFPPSGLGIMERMDDGIIEAAAVSTGLSDDGEEVEAKVDPKVVTSGVSRPVDI